MLLLQPQGACPHFIASLSLALQVASLSSTEYVFSPPKKNKNWGEIDDLLNVKMLGMEIFSFKNHSIIYIFLWTVTYSEKTSTLFSHCYGVPALCEQKYA